MYVNELSFSYCNEFNLYPKFPSEAGNFWNNPRTKEILPFERMTNLLMYGVSYTDEQTVSCSAKHAVLTQDENSLKCIQCEMF